MSKGEKPLGTHRSVSFAVQVVLGLGVLALLGTFLSVRRYVSESPRFCQSCHELAPEVAVWVESEHRGLRCQECHHQSVEDGLRSVQVYLMGGSTSLEATHAAVRVDSCASCHASHDTEWSEIANSAGHVAHTGPDGLTCTNCHGKQMHFDRPARATCVNCHSNEEAGLAHETDHCLACHNFLSTEQGQSFRPRQDDCLRCHRLQDRPVLIPAEAPMQFVCSGCHQPHNGNQIALCEDCHRPSEIVGLHSGTGHGVCSDCHEQHSWTSQRSQCYSCHDNLRSHHPEERCVRCHVFEAGPATVP